MARRLAVLLLVMEVLGLLVRLAAIIVAIDGVMSDSAARVAFAIFLWITVGIDNRAPGIIDAILARAKQKEQADA